MKSVRGYLLPWFHDTARIEGVRHAAAMEAHLRTGYPVRLVRFSLREVIEELPS